MTTLRERVEALRPDPSKCNMRELNNDSAYRCGYVNAMDEASNITADGDATIAALTGDVLYWGRQLSAAMERAEKAEAELESLKAWKARMMHDTCNGRMVGDPPRYEPECVSLRAEVARTASTANKGPQ